MSYEIYIETDGGFCICCGRWKNFNDAKNQMAQMIVDLVANPTDFGRWHKFKEEIPEDVRNLIEGYEKSGIAYNKKIIEGDTNNYRYEINGDEFNIHQSKNPEFEDSFGISTNTLNMNGECDEYYFRWFARIPSTETIIIRMKTLI